MKVRPPDLARPARAAIILLAALLACASVPVHANALDTFIAKRTQCDHFRGEEAYDTARGRFLARQLRRYCRGTDRELAALRRRYAHRPAVLRRLAQFETRVE